MINEGWATSGLVGGLKGVGYVGKNVAKGAANTIGTGTNYIANTKIGGGLLAAATGAYLANRIIKNRKENNTTTTQKKKPLAAWQKKKNTFNEMNHNLPGLPTLAVMPNKNRDKKRKITGNPRSVANALKTSVKGIKQGAENTNISVQVKKGQQHMKKTMAKTGYDKTLGKISTV